MVPGSAVRNNVELVPGELVIQLDPNMNLFVITEHRLVNMSFPLKGVKMESLPATSDIKMIDIWLILCQLVPFAQVVLLTAIEYIREEEKEGKEAEKIVERQGSPIVKENKTVEKEVDLTKEKPKPEEAWVPMNTEPAQNDIMHKLLTVGRYIDCDDFF